MKRILSYLLFIVFVFAYGSSLAQKSGYYIRNYLPKEYKGFNQVWQAVQDHNGFMFFAGTNNVFIYSGQHWETVPVKAGTATRQIFIDPVDSTIYAGAVGDFGYISRDKSGKWQFTSLATGLPESQSTFNDVWKIYSFHGNTYFQASERIFKVSRRKIVKVIEAGANGFALSFICNDKFYVRQRNVGLMSMTDDQLTLVPGGEIFKDKRILSMLPLSKTKNIVLTGDEGFILMDTKPALSNAFAKEMYASDNYLTQAGVLGAKWVNDSVMVVNSRKGIAFYSRQGKLKEILDKSSGLNDESVADVYIDRERNLWLSHNYGMSCISYNSPMLLYDDKAGYTGTLEQLHFYNNELYASASDGLFKAKKPDPLHPNVLIMEPTEIRNTEVWYMFNYRDYMLLACSEGLIRMRNDKAEKITDYYTNYMSLIDSLNIAVTAEKNGFSIVSLDKGSVKQHYNIPGEELMQIGRVRKLKKADRYEAWIYTRYKKAIHVEFALNDSSLAVKEYGPEKGFYYNGYTLLDYGDTTYFCTPDSCYRYMPASDKGSNSICFGAATDIFNKFYKGEVNDLKEPFNFQLYFKSVDSIAVYGKDANGNLKASHILIPGRIQDNTINHIFTRPDGNVYAVIDNLIMIMDTKKAQLTTSGFHCLIKSATIGNDSVVFNGGSPNASLDKEIEYAKNHISFKFEAPFFFMDVAVLFSCRLDGFDTAWSKPSFISEKDYTSLPEGTYTFRVRAFNGFNVKSSEATYTFTIAAPWYRTAFAYFIYIILFISILYFTVKISAIRLRRQKDRLEGMVRERTAEVVAQKQMLETAYVEIKDSIRYAKRIQNALLASDKLLKEHLQEYFIYYKPKDIVSGDFYWAQPKGDWLYMITADCTGHGVPGAFMSLLSISFLNEAISGTSFVSPDEVLGDVRSKIIEALRSDGSEEGGKDGMDCVLCAYNFKTKQLLFSASNNPVWICRDKNMIEYKPDKYPVGKHDRENEAFHLQTVELLPGDIVYTFTDGYADQFGGAAGKKFKVKQLKELLLSIAHLPMNEQKDVVSKTIRKWKKGIEQIDDILVVGVKIV